MRKITVFHKLLYFINSVCATLLLLSYLLPFISPKKLPAFSVLSLAVPFLIIINTLFVIYWLIKLKKYVFISVFVLVIGIFISTPFFKLSKKKVSMNDDLTIMSYNVRMFNHYKWINQEGIDQLIVKLIKEEKPDVLAIQEYYNTKTVDLIDEYPYWYFIPKSKSKKLGLAIFSRFQIVNQGSLDFKNSGNNAIFTDIAREKDTFRLYNIHLQSLKINPTQENFGETNSGKLFHRLQKGFEKQAYQTEKFLAHDKLWEGKEIVCGDFNNTAYSWIYKQIIQDKKDAFLEAGSGFGKSFRYIFPTRIDFILTDEFAQVNSYKTIHKKYSDHYPIVARINWK